VANNNVKERPSAAVIAEAAAVPGAPGERRAGAESEE